MPTTYQLHRAEVEAYVQIGGIAGPQEIEDATHNLMKGQPAFMSLETFSNAPAGSLLYYANHFAGVERGIAAYHNEFPPSSYDIGEARFLDTLIPLNDTAVASLQEAYELTGTFRSKAELMGRMKRCLTPALAAERVAA